MKKLVIFFLNYINNLFLTTYVHWYASHLRQTDTYRNIKNKTVKLSIHTSWKQPISTLKLYHFFISRLKVFYPNNCLTIISLERHANLGVLYWKVYKGIWKKFTKNYRFIVFLTIYRNSEITAQTTERPATEQVAFETLVLVNRIRRILRKNYIISEFRFDSHLSSTIFR